VLPGDRRVFATSLVGLDVTRLARGVRDASV
jgi:hypothetical protein